MFISTLVKMFRKEEKKKMAISKNEMAFTIMEAMGLDFSSYCEFKRITNRKNGVITRMYKQALVVLEAEKR